MQNYSKGVPRHMSVKRQADANDEWALDLIAGFLNTASEGATDRKWQALPRKANTKKRGTFQLDRMKLDDAISLRCQMHEALSFLRLEKWQFTEKKIPIPYAELISQLNDLKTPTEYYAREIKKSNKTWPGQRVLRTGVAGGLFRFGLALQPQRKDSTAFSPAL